jgi:hypothetical protein
MTVSETVSFFFPHHFSRESEKLDCATTRRLVRTMGTVRGIANPTTACHVTSSLALLCHGLAPIREVILNAWRRNAITGKGADPVCRELGRFLEEYYAHACDHRPLQQTVEVPVRLYRALLDETGIQADNVGDAVTTLAKVLDHLRRCDDPPEIARVVKAALDGSCHRIIQDGYRRKILPQRSLPCPFPVQVEGDSTTLLEALQRALQPQRVVGYQWVGGFEVLSSDPICDQTSQCDTKKTLVVEQAPPTWIIHVDRVKRGSSQRAVVDVPMSFDASSLGVSAVYRLMGGVVFISDGDQVDDGEGAGHTIAVIRGQGGDDNDGSNDRDIEWILIDDGNLESISEKEARRMMSGCQSDQGMAEGVLLVYQQRGWDWRALLSETQQSTLADVDWTRPTMLIGKRVKVKWAREKWYNGTVSSYDGATRKHTVTYDDGDTRSYDLKRKTVEWL